MGFELFPPHLSACLCVCVTTWYLKIRTKTQGILDPLPRACGAGVAPAASRTSGSADRPPQGRWILLQARFSSSKSSLLDASGCQNSSSRPGKCEGFGGVFFSFFPVQFCASSMVVWDEPWAKKRQRWRGSCHAHI